ncbi:MAG: GerMN domain-containing protein [Candidatus Melainabacteria bacterium]|nr:GerMN domain-containing protein [Candidatus Melainabacteria bacterium]
MMPRFLQGFSLASLRLLHLVPVFLALALVSGCQFSGCGQSPEVPPAGQTSEKLPLGQPVQVPIPKNSVTVYFSKLAGNSAATEPVYRPARPDADRLELAIHALLTGPTVQEVKRGLFSEIPKGTRLIAIRRTPKGIRVNLSSAFASGGGANSMQQRLSEVKQTIRAVEKQKPVFIDVDGAELHVLGGEGLEVPEPVNQPPAAEPLKPVVP